MALETGLPVVAVTVNEPLDRLLELAEGTGAHVLQLHGEEPPELLAALRERGPWKLWKCLRVRTEGEVPEGIRNYGPVADGLLLDGWHPEHRGGSGVRFPWDLLEPQRDAFPPALDFIAAGGLTPENVAEAVRRMRPDMVDVSSGVEIETGVKDPARIRAFIENAKHQGSSL
jgi:phosphoribosylanthranilate isomerase